MVSFELRLCVVMHDDDAEWPDEIRKALKAVDLMKVLDGQIALGNKSGTKALGEHKVNNFA